MGSTKNRGFVLPPIIFDQSAGEIVGADGTKLPRIMTEEFIVEEFVKRKLEHKALRFPHILHENNNVFRSNPERLCLEQQYRPNAYQGDYKIWLFLCSKYKREQRRSDEEKGFWANTICAPIRIGTSSSGSGNCTGFFWKGTSTFYLGIEGEGSYKPTLWFMHEYFSTLSGWVVCKIHSPQHIIQK